MSYKFADSLLLRMPVKSWTGFHETSFQALLHQPYFLAAIYVASPGFYARLIRVDFNYDNLSTRERNTIKKYYNRMCFRPTPFGLFSAIALVNWDSQTNITIGKGEQNYHPLIKPDQTYIMALSRELLNNEMAGSGLYTPNPFLYRAGKEYRFLLTDLDESYKKRDYDLQSTDYSVLLKNLIIYCAQGKSGEDIIQYIADNAGCSTEDAEGYFQFMADSQLLLNSLRPNLTGDDYMERLLQHLGDTENERLVYIKAVLQALNIPKLCPDVFIHLNKKLKDALPEHLTSVQDEQLSIILQNRSVKGCLNSEHQQQIRDAIFALDQLLPQEPPKALTQFMKAFKKQFDQQQVPLLKVLDPEIGLGYQEPDTISKNPLLETLNVHSKPAENSMKWMPAHRYLLDCWHSQLGNTLPVIKLDKEGLLRLKKQDEDMQLLGMSVLFRVVNGKVVLDTVGGVNAAALLGRFTVTDVEIAAAARQMATEVEVANPDIIFAELLHLSDSHTDNINRRERIWTKELPITAHSLAKYDDQIQLADLYVSVENDKVVLRSARHHKMVVPRLTSAYNHSINKLPLFYFLADVAYQFGKTNFTLDMAQFFPGLSFYPRVEYGAAVLYLATWVLNKSDVDLLSHEDDQDVLTAFNNIASKLRLPHVFTLAQGDQQLVFYRDRPDEILLLAESVKNKNEVIIKEYLQDDATSSVLKDSNGNSYVTQFNAFLYTDHQLRFLPKPKPQKQTRTQRHFVLGSDWLYLKIYIPKLGISGLLLKISPLLKRTYKHGPIKKWFFIRYNDHAPHIKLRLKIAPDDLGEILAAFKQKLEKSIYQHVVSEYQADTYTREIERYQAANYDLTEDFFWRSSEMITGLLKAERSIIDPALSHLFALYTTRDVLNVFLPDRQQQLLLVQNNYQQYMLEFEDKKIPFELDKKYRDLSKAINTTLRDADFYAQLSLKTTAAKFIKTTAVLAGTVQKQQNVDKSFLTAIIHMHLNRIFIDDPRKQEMMIYYFLYKYLVSDMARKK